MAVAAGAAAHAVADEAGDPSAIELAVHPCFIATLYQTERSAASGAARPLITAFAAPARR